MKVISKKRDYYDNVFSALEQTDEKTVFFERKPVVSRLTANEIFIKDPNTKDNLKEKELNDYLNLTKKINKIFQQKLLDKQLIKTTSNGNVSFLTMYSMYDKNYNTLGFLSIEAFVIAGKTKILFNISPYQPKGDFKQELEKLPEYMNIDEFECLIKKFDLVDNDFKVFKTLSEMDLSDLTLESNKPIVQISLCGYGHYEITFNPDNLKEYNFERIIDPYTMHQEIETYISQQILKESTPKEPTNEIKIVNHGFDLKQSFRHRKA